MEVSAELLGQSDDDALRATQEAEPVDVFVRRDLADEFGTVAAQASKDVVDLSQQHAIVAAILDHVTVSPGRRGYNRFDESGPMAVWDEIVAVGEGDCLSATA